MMSNGSDGLFELPAGAGGEPFEAPDLRRRTNFQSRASRAGADFKAMAMTRLAQAGGTILRLDFEVRGFPVDAEVVGSNGRRYLVLARGTPDEQERGALRRTDTVEKAGFMAMQLARHQTLPILMITSDLPTRSTKAGHYLASLSDDVWDVISYRADFAGYRRLQSHLQAIPSAEHPDAPWRSPLPAPAPQLFIDDRIPDNSASQPVAVNDDESLP